MPATKKKAVKNAAKKATKTPAKATAKTTAKKTATAAVPNGTKVRVRMYRQGLGDCFLLTFFTGASPVHMLIDCGSIGEQTTHVKLEQVGADIVHATNGRLAMLIATHEHQDHVNGFLRNKAIFAAPGFKVDRVWQAWTEDETDDVAQDFVKYKKDLVNAVALASSALETQAKRHPDLPRTDEAVALNRGVRGLLEFAGAPPAGTPLFGATGLSESVDEAMAWVTTRATNADKFLKPGTVMEPSWLPGVRVYVLGPPRDKTKINSLGQHGDPNLYELTAQASVDFATCATFAISPSAFADYRAGLEGDARALFERRLPFDPRFRVEITDDAAFRATYAAYYDPAESWRRVDTDWLSATGSLALQLDNATNNTSLVLAFELIDDGRVLLFPADAQLGNWLSWDDYTFKVNDHGSTRDVTAADLLTRTAFYKVGHHSSFNATVKAKGLERMRRDDLVAMIPLDSTTAENKWEKTSWPATKVYAALCERTVGRVLRSDTGWPDASDRPSAITKTKWNAARKAVEDSGRIAVGGLYIDYHLV
jgi:hypothetical protein